MKRTLAVELLQRIVFLFVLSECSLGLVSPSPVLIEIDRSRQTLSPLEVRVIDASFDIGRHS